jgi:hypothetical protein
MRCQRAALARQRLGMQPNFCCSATCLDGVRWAVVNSSKPPMHSTARAQIATRIPPAHNNRLNLFSIRDESHTKVKQRSLSLGRSLFRSGDALIVW